MTCERVQQLLLADPDEPSPPGDREALAAHLAVCSVCRREREQLARLDRALVGWVAAASVAPETRTHLRLDAPQTRSSVRIRRVAATTGRVATFMVLRAAGLLVLALTLLGLGVSLGVPQARTLVQAGLRPLLGGYPTLPVLPFAGDRVWVEAATPASEAGLSPRPTFELQLGYTLVSAPEAMLSVRLAARPESQTRYFAPPVRVAAGTNRAVVRFSVDEARARQLLATGEVQIEVLMRAAVTSGEAPLLTQTNYGAWVLPATAP